MRVLRSIRGLVGCKVTVREVVTTRSGSWMDPKLVFSLNVSERRRFNENNIKDVERALTEEIGKEEDEGELLLKKEREELKRIERDSWRAKEEMAWKEFKRKEAKRLRRKGGI